MKILTHINNMTNNKQQTAVDIIIEFCQKQMDNDSSIHKGVYLSIIKFCQEQITEESEIHWKTTLLMMTNNKQQPAVDASELAMKLYPFSNSERNAFINGYNKAKEMEKEKLEDAWVEGFKNWNPSKTFEQYYEETYGGNK